MRGCGEILARLGYGEYNIFFTRVFSVALNLLLLRLPFWIVTNALIGFLFALTDFVFQTRFVALSWDRALIPPRIVVLAVWQPLFIVVEL